jgi:hypothetical protein
MGTKMYKNLKRMILNVFIVYKLIMIELEEQFINKILFKVLKINK